MCVCAVVQTRALPQTLLQALLVLVALRALALPFAATSVDALHGVASATAMYVRVLTRWDLASTHGSWCIPLIHHSDCLTCTAAHIQSARQLETCMAPTWLETCIRTALIIICVCYYIVLSTPLQSPVGVYSLP